MIATEKHIFTAAFLNGKSLAFFNGKLLSWTFPSKRANELFYIFSKSIIDFDASVNQRIVDAGLKRSLNKLWLKYYLNYALLIITGRACLCICEIGCMGNMSGGPV